MLERRKDLHVINLMQSVYEQENVSMVWRDSLIYQFIKRSETSRIVGIADIPLIFRKGLLREGLGTHTLVE